MRRILFSNSESLLLRIFVTAFDGLVETAADLLEYFLNICILLGTAFQERNAMTASQLMPLCKGNFSESRANIALITHKNHLDGSFTTLDLC